MPETVADDVPSAVTVTDVPPEAVVAGVPSPRQRPSRRFWALLALVCVLGAGIRVTYVLAFKQDRSSCAALMLDANQWGNKVPENLCGDALVYHDGANLLVDGKGFITPTDYLYGDGREYASADHPPLYYLYLAAFSAIGLRSVLAHQLASVLLGVLSIVLVGLLGREIAGERAGLLAALGTAGYVYVWVNDGLVMSETIAITCTAALLWQTYRFWKRPTVANMAILGVLGGLTALTRAELVLYLPLVATVMVLRFVPTWRRRLALLGVGAVAAVAVIAPWVVRNMTTFNNPVTLSTGLGITLTYTNCDPVYSGDLIGYWYFPCINSVVDQLNQNKEAIKGWDQSDDERILRRQGLDYLKAHTGRLPVVVLARVARQWNLFKPDQHTAFDTFEDRERTLSRIGLAQYYFLVPVAIAGTVILWRRRVPVWPLLSVGVVVTFTAAISYGTTRFRAPFEIVLVILAAVAVDVALSYRRRQPATVDAVIGPPTVSPAGGSAVQAPFGSS